MQARGLSWTADTYSRAFSTTAKERRKISLDEAFALSQIVRLPLADLMETDGDDAAVSGRARESWGSVQDGIQRVYLAMFDTINARQVFVQANARLVRSGKAPYAPEDLEAMWKLSDLFLTGGMHEFTVARVEAIYEQEARDEARASASSSRESLAVRLGREEAHQENQRRFLLSLLPEAQSNTSNKAN